MAKNDDKCRDCSKCTERGISRFAKKIGKGALTVGTLGTSALAASAANSVRRMCPVCGHALSHHEVVDGRFRD